jgi:hypothetical protein
VQWGRGRSANKENLWIFLVCCALPVSGLKIATLTVLAQHKGHERISEARKRSRRASPIGMKIA